MGLSTEWRKQRKESVNLKRDQHKISNVKSREKSDRACRIISRDLTHMQLESYKEKRDEIG